MKSGCRVVWSAKQTKCNCGVVQGAECGDYRPDEVVWTSAMVIVAPISNPTQLRMVRFLALFEGCGWCTSLASNKLIATRQTLN